MPKPSRCSIWLGCFAVICLFLMQALMPVIESTHECDKADCTVCACIVNAGHSVKKVGGPSVPPIPHFPTVDMSVLVLFILPVLTFAIFPKTPVINGDRMND